jgi:hypothetical protein
MCVFQKLDNVSPKVGAGEGALQVLNDLTDSRCAIDALHDLTGTAGQLDHTLRKQQDMRVLRRLPLKAVMAANLDDRVVV